MGYLVEPKIHDQHCNYSIGCAIVVSGIDREGNLVMAYAIVINLNYDTFPADDCQIMWDEIKERMVAAGFHRDGRSFVINLPDKEACDLAQKIIESIEDHLEYHRKHLHKYMKEFYGYPLAAKTNLLLPSLSEIRVMDVHVSNDDD